MFIKTIKKIFSKEKPPVLHNYLIYYIITDGGTKKEYGNMRVELDHQMDYWDIYGITKRIDKVNKTSNNISIRSSKPVIVNIMPLG